MEFILMISVILVGFWKEGRFMDSEIPNLTDRKSVV